MSIKVLVVDDSALIREVLQRMLTRDGDIDVVGTAVDPIDAREKIKALDPDVVTLDIEMPNMNGLAFLERLMRLRPTPVVMVSTLTKKGASETLLALELGAVDFVAKPAGAVSLGMDQFAPTLKSKVRAAAAARLPASRRLRERVQFRTSGSPSPRPRKALSEPIEPSVEPVRGEGIVLVGTSTGGPPALEALLVREVKGHGRQKSYLDQYSETEFAEAFLPKVEITLWVEDELTDEVIDKVIAVARTGRIGDGKILVVPVLASIALGNETRE